MPTPSTKELELLKQLDAANANRIDEAVYNHKLAEVAEGLSHEYMSSVVVNELCRKFAASNETDMAAAYKEIIKALVRQNKSIITEMPWGNG